jgi:hypothetical protein
LQLFNPTEQSKVLSTLYLEAEINQLAALFADETDPEKFLIVLNAMDPKLKLALFNMVYPKARLCTLPPEHINDASVLNKFIRALPIEIRFDCIIQIYGDNLNVLREKLSLDFSALNQLMEPVRISMFEHYCPDEDIAISDYLFTNLSFFFFVKILEALPSRDRLALLKLVYPKEALDRLYELIIRDERSIIMLFFVFDEQASELIEHLCACKRFEEYLNNFSILQLFCLIKARPDCFHSFHAIAYNAMRKPVPLIKFEEPITRANFLSVATLYMAYVEQLFRDDQPFFHMNIKLFQMGMRKVIRALEPLDLTVTDRAPQGQVVLNRNIAWLAKLHIYPFAEMVFGEAVDEKLISNADAGVGFWPDD